MTARLTKVNAVNAPKLMNDVEVATSRKIAANPITPHNAMLKTGVWNRSDTQPNARCGSNPGATHRIQQSRHRRLGGQARGELADDQPGQEHRAEKAAADGFLRYPRPAMRSWRTFRQATPMSRSTSPR